MKDMTPQEAKSFEHHSATNAERIQSAVFDVMGCKCVPYEDIFSFKRCKALGAVVPKGGIPVVISLPKIPTTLSDVEETPSFMNKRIFVWCRCQIENAKKGVTASEKV